MVSDRRGAEPLQYMMEVENGMVHGLEYDPEKEEYTREDLTDEDKSPEKLLEATRNHEYDFEYEGFSNDSVNATRVGINSVNGVVDVYNGEDLVDRYSLAAVLENDEGRPELVFSGVENIDTFSKSSKDIEWSPTLSAAYEAVYHELFDRPDKDEETVALYSDDSDDSGSGVSTHSPVSARQAVKRIDDFIQSIDDPARGIENFEENGGITIEGDEHYGQSRGFDAARNVKTDLNRLSSAGLMEYSTQPLNENGDESEVDLKIEERFLDGKGSVRDDFDALGDFNVKDHDERVDLIGERM